MVNLQVSPKSLGTGENIEVLLVLWARKVMRDNIGIGYRTMTSEYRLWRGTGGGGSFVMIIPHYWPDSRLIQLHEAILSLPHKLKKPLIGRYLFGYTAGQLGRLCGCSRRSVWNYLNQAKDRLEKTL